MEIQELDASVNAQVFVGGATFDRLSRIRFAGKGMVDESLERSTNPESSAITTKSI